MGRPVPETGSSLRERLGYIALGMAIGLPLTGMIIMGRSGAGAGGVGSAPGRTAPEGVATTARPDAPAVAPAAAAPNAVPGAEAILPTRPRP